MNHGISILHGPHQVAQKSSRMTLPFSEESFTSLLLRSLSVKFRLAGFAFAGPDQVGGAPGAASACANGHSGTAGSVSNASASAASVATAHRIFMRNSSPT